MKKNKHGLKLLLLVLALSLVVMGCAQNNGKEDGDPSQGTPPEQTEDGVNPTDPEDEIEQPGEQDIDPNVTPDGEDVSKKTIILYYSDKDLMEMFGLETEIEAATDDDLLKTAIETWMEGPKHNNLTNLVPPAVVVEYVKDVDGVAHVSFSKELKNANLGSSGELFLLDQITLIMEQFGYEKTQILIEGEVEESLLGHVTTSEPLMAPDASDIEILN